MVRAPLGGGAFWLAGGAFFLALLAPRVHGELPPFDNSPEVYSFDSYYTVARWLLLTVLLLLATNLFSMFYLRWAVGSDTEEARDSVPIVLCALSQYLYLVKFFVWEIGYMRSIDIIVDRAGFEIQWGCLSLIHI